jgi:cytosine/adenosine deaminase-related metal-dependent hydrolase
VVTLSDEGVIVDISASAHLDREAGTEFFPGILLPGLRNAHCHLELSHLGGTIPPGGGFAAFVEGMKAARSAANSETEKSSQAAIRLWDARMWAEGVQEVCDICNGESTFEAKRRSPIRYHNFREIFGAGAAVPENVPDLTPHSLYALDRNTFARIVERATGPLSIHFMESTFEVPEPAERLVAQVPRDKPVMLVHNCLVGQREIDIVMGHFTAPVTWVLCPGSNRYISGLTPPVDLLRRNGLRIAVGTDSLASNETLSVVRELRLLGEAGRVTEGETGSETGGVPLAELLGWACADRIEVGRSPGLVLLSGVDPATLTLTENACTERVV